MARNARNMSITAFEVTYGVVEDGKLVQHTDVFETESPRKLNRAISEATGVDYSKLVIISTKSISTEYRIPDVVKALTKLHELGLAEIVNQPKQPKATATKSKK